MHATSDARITMQYERYEKSIVAEKGVELINWPEGIPFVNPSEIGSLHSLRAVFAALTHKDLGKRCRWVSLSEEEWERRRDIQRDAELATAPQKRKRKSSEVIEESDDGEDETNVEEARPKKKQKVSKKAKENMAPEGLGGQVQKKGKVKRAFKKKGGNAALAAGNKN